ncbi:MAG: glycoside hydrolase family 95 protein [Phycisphaerae bacterium]|nr:glycoside hydrolase family 95 protein [Phycisphaerae bacterium]
MMFEKTAVLCYTLIIFTFILTSYSSALAKDLPVPQRGFISTDPADNWEYGLISGNGTLGANVFGQPLDETVVFTHERLFMPQGAPTMPPANGQRLFEIRNLIDRGLYKQATELAFNFSGQDGFMYPDPFVPAFDFKIKMESKGDAKEYMRSLDFQTGQSTVQWSDDRGTFQRHLFVSRADGLAVMQISGSGKGLINCRLELMPRNPSPELLSWNRKKDQAERSAKAFKEYVSNVKITAEQSTLTIREDFALAYPGSIHGLEGVAKVIATNGTITVNGQELVIADADEVLIYIDVEMVYDPDQTVISKIKRQMDGLSKDYATLLNRHAIIHGEIFNRVKLDIGGDSDHNLTSEELLSKTSNEKVNKALIEKLFDAGRYNILSSTGELPPTLQGLWAGTYVPGWASDYTHNGNLPSAISSILMGNMPELMLAYTSYMESIVPYMEINAKNIFNARGIVLPSRSTTHGFNNALANKFAGGFWVAGAPWASHYFYDYYLHTGDKKFLVEHALPFMEKTGLFFEDYLYEGNDGKYIFSPTQSPENTPINTNSQGSFNATMDVAAAKELLISLIAASEELNVNQDKIPVWKAMLKKMPPYMISSEGMVKEWLTSKLDDNNNHRHASHLYPLYDGVPEEIANSPELQKAFKNIIEYKLNEHWRKGSGYMSFGLVQLGQAATGLGESELAYYCLTHLVNRFWLNNLASTHNHKQLFNMDVSGGMPSVIIKMLVASEAGKVQLIPALPKDWPVGTIEGVLCRGQIEVKSLQWSKGKVLAKLVSAKDQTITLEMPSEISSYSVKNGNAKLNKTDNKYRLKLSLPAGKEVSLEIIMLPDQNR